MLLGCTLFESAQGSRSQAIAHRTPEHRSSSLCRPAPVLGPQHHWPNHPPATRQRGSALSAMLLEPGGHREHPKCSALSAALSPASSTAPAAVLCPRQYGAHRILPAMPLGQELLGVHPPARSPPPGQLLPRPLCFVAAPVGPGGLRPASADRNNRPAGDPAGCNKIFITGMFEKLLYYFSEERQSVMAY